MYREPFGVVGMIQCKKTTVKSALIDVDTHGKCGFSKADDNRIANLKTTIKASDTLKHQPYGCAHALGTGKIVGRCSSVSLAFIVIFANLVYHSKHFKAVNSIWSPPTISDILISIICFAQCSPSVFSHGDQCYLGGGYALENRLKNLMK